MTLLDIFRLNVDSIDSKKKKTILILIWTRLDRLIESVCKKFTVFELVAFLSLEPLIVNICRVYFTRR